MDKSEIPHDHVTYDFPSGVSKKIFEPMVRMTQTVHLSCTDTNIVFKWTKARFHMTTSPRIFHRVCPNEFQAYGTLSLNHVPILHQDQHYLQKE